MHISMVKNQIRQDVHLRLKNVKADISCLCSWAQIHDKSIIWIRYLIIKKDVCILSIDLSQYPSYDEHGSAHTLRLSRDRNDAISQLVVQCLFSTNNFKSYDIPPYSKKQKLRNF